MYGGTVISFIRRVGRVVMPVHFIVLKDRDSHEVLPQAKGVLRFLRGDSHSIPCFSTRPVLWPRIQVVKATGRSYLLLTFHRVTPNKEAMRTLLRNFVDFGVFIRRWGQDRVYWSYFVVQADQRRICW